MTAGESGGSVVRRILLGSQLRRLREGRGITREAAGYSIRASESKISRMELGRVSFKARDVEDLLTLYGVADGAERAALLDLAREANVAGWWHSYSDVLPGWFQTYVGLEGAASLIRVYEVQFVHGLLQTEAYAHAVVERGMPGASAAEIDRRVALRLERQKLLVSERAPGFHVVLDEAALRRPYGDRTVMREQLEHLIEISERPNVTLQVMPFSFGGHAGESGAFALLRFPESDLSDVVYLEQLTSALYLDKREEVAQYERAMERLQRDSPDPSRTRDLLRGLVQLT
ncbi:helix-turn-helix domain-containing protein [Streptomyces albidoflavus]|uniref:Helix-turn-helix domain-containing protein n=2 Tax=Streptomyces albidoflavus TaxID=1886 RepID=A0A2M9SNW3_9ACTN|nr:MULTISPECIES: helix-turn-helix transcriptional regulator [Streptomyces]MBO1288264.1 helix-turn-helix domain-containing protein [Streptomyces sampsonii]MYQ70038.1 helix-turn-helix domain-containing protein [Streptomyces sp. SID4934]MYW57090.1 helix-turn-helix domain-containing protein [Streptomyces sp. SID8370]MYW88408.1 helix-turn-helix domain-containing protein [Streptomyces sp. SID8371]MYX50800.1 helix-turn-helix domain-containing protein [Streptomyces sp. SID8385]NUW09829.1 helix-turn-h